MIGRAATLLLVVSALICGACTPPPVKLEHPERQFNAKEYDDQLRTWTRRGERYSGFLSRIFAYSTYKSWTFRQAQVVYRQQTERLPQPDVAALIERERREATETHQFFVAAHTHEWRWNYLERTGDDALWRLRLLNDQGDSVAPLKIERLGTGNPHYTALYPYYEDFYVGYLVSFPRKSASGRDILRPGIKHFILRISGTQAVVDLNWEVAP